MLFKFYNNVLNEFLALARKIFIFLFFCSFWLTKIYFQGHICITKRRRTNLATVSQQMLPYFHFIFIDVYTYIIFYFMCSTNNACLICSCTWRLIKFNELAQYECIHTCAYTYIYLHIVGQSFCVFLLTNSHYSNNSNKMSNKMKLWYHKSEEQQTGRASWQIRFTSTSSSVGCSAHTHPTPQAPHHTPDTTHPTHAHMHPAVRGSHVNVMHIPVPLPITVLLYVSQLAISFFVYVSRFACDIIINNKNKVKMLLLLLLFVLFLLLSLLSLSSLMHFRWAALWLA